MDDLGVKEASLKSVVDRLTTPTDELVMAYYELLRCLGGARPVDLRKFLGECDAFGLSMESGRFRVIGLFFPRERGDVEFPVRSGCAITDLPDMEGLRDLLADAGVRRFEWPSCCRVCPQNPRNVHETQEHRNTRFRPLRQYYNTERGATAAAASDRASASASARASSAESTLRPAAKCISRRNG